MKQSSIEWAVDQLIEKDLLMIYGKPLEDNDLIGILKQAKAMHKEEIKNAIQLFGYMGAEEEAEQYYNETFNTK